VRELELSNGRPSNLPWREAREHGRISWKIQISGSLPVNDRRHSERRGKGASLEMDESAWVNKMKKKVEGEMIRKEIEMILYWKGEIEKILGKKHEGLGTLQIEMQQFLTRMQNRVKVLKQSLGN
jgi:hypothetical protein